MTNKIQLIVGFQLGYFPFILVQMSKERKNLNIKIKIIIIGYKNKIKKIKI